jgi:myosin heavy subunit
VQSTQLDDEEGFLNEVKKEGEIPQSIGDVLQPDEKERRLLDTLSEKLEELIGSLGEQLSAEVIDQLDIVFTGKSFEQGVTDLLKSLFGLIEQYESSKTQADQIIQSMESTITELEEERDECNQKLLKLTTGVEERPEDTEGKEENESEEVQRIRDQKAELEQQLETFLAQIRSLKQNLLDQQTQQAQKDEAVRKLGIVGSELESLRAEAAKKEKIIQDLREKETQLDALRTQVTTLEEQDRLSKQDKQALQQKTADLDRLSAEKQTLEQRLADYEDNLNELQRLVASIPLPEKFLNANQDTPFDHLKRKIMSLVPVRVVQNEEEFPKNILSLPVLTLPSLLSAKASRNTQFCDFLNALSQLVSKYFDSEQGQALENQINEVLNTYGKTSIPERIANIIQIALLYGSGKIEETSEEFRGVNFDSLSQIEDLKTIAPQAETVFLEGQPQEVATEIQAYTKVLDQKNLPSYSVLFLLYLLALRDWVNCIQLNSKPLECPQIPPRLQRTVKCN